MTISARSVLMAGVATVTASAVLIAPSVQPPPPPRPTIQLAAAVQPLAEQPPLLTVLLNSPLALLGPAAPLGTLPPPPAPIQFAIAPNLADTVDNIYLAVEPWVRYGFAVAESIVRWIPYVGWFAGQIGVFYNFFEGLVASGTFNITDFLRGNGGVIDNVVDFGIDVGLAFIWLGLDEVRQFFPLPPIPLPPRPPHEGRPGPNLLSLMGLTGMSGVGVENGGSLQALLDRVLNPLNADGGVDGAFAGGATLSSRIRNRIAEIGDLLGVPSSPSGELDRLSGVSTVPPLVKNLLNGIQPGRDPLNSGAGFDEAPAGPLAQVAKTVRTVRTEIRANFNAATERRIEGAATNGVDRAQGEVRGPIAKAADDFVNAVRKGRSGREADEVAKAPTTVAKSFRDSAKKVVKEVREAGKDVRQAVKDRPATTNGDDDDDNDE